MSEVRVKWRYDELWDKPLPEGLTGGVFYDRFHSKYPGRNISDLEDFELLEIGKEMQGGQRSVGVHVMEGIYGIRDQQQQRSLKDVVLSADAKLKGVAPAGNAGDPPAGRLSTNQNISVGDLFKSIDKRMKR